MAEPTQIAFSYKEIVEALIKKHDLHEGLWGLNVNFGLQATNIGPNDTDLKPAGVLAILGIGLQKMDKENNMTVDAAKVNPKPKSQSRHN